ncbi:CgeB family protein [Aequorivita lipolytica]|uniref:Glycosyltransferase n=1 Tax=Aequorivita lipolytica TaxID=153267 RepID=A0A5C6YP08_9FLAO|nr:glycosyltransferase [Aequorivita lipolytica]TXD68591.1 glycosyltransferase [Aequorivita lipolytica]SRX53258.1 hypothetical protein AEQU2_02487 [Aequorivita lipolytica]
MKVLYVGQYSPGTTSKMRGDKIFGILNAEIFDVIDIHIPFYNTNRLWRSLGFRYNKGPLIGNVNRYVLSKFKKINYDLIWVDKGIFLNEKVIQMFRDYTTKMVHFTPDPAFTYNKSALFNQTLSYYDFLVTTKSYELDFYYKHVDPSKIIYTTQGFDKEIHKKSESDFKSKKGLVFIGRHEKEREIVIRKLLEDEIPVTLAGTKWETFANSHKTNPYLNYLGKGVYGDDYVKQFQNAHIGWGAISKWFPELHTTRTFEIPACGTALLTERNKETTSFFDDSEAIFYDNETDLLEKINFYLNNEKKLELIASRGYEKVHQAGYDYESILRKVLKTVMA